MFQDVAKIYINTIKHVLINKSSVCIFEQNLKKCEKNINNSLKRALLSVNELHKIYLLYKKPVLMNIKNYVVFKTNMRIIKYTLEQANFHSISRSPLNNSQKNITPESPGTSTNSSSISTNRMCNAEMEKSEHDEEDSSTINLAQ